MCLWEEKVEYEMEGERETVRADLNAETNLCEKTSNGRKTMLNYCGVDGENMLENIVPVQDPNSKGKNSATTK